mmetsp:Transcript_40451/g.41266  ORF Transcript_40451/g.41266 Transcript_40451/m.41266 type:complete len:215 (+) Transcript_40451:161-805(+)
MSSKTDREPCPWRIVDDAGGAFAFGIVGGGIWNAIGGARNAPKGLVFQNAINRCKARAPILGGSFAVWGTFFSIFDCSLASVRKREDPWNAILAGAATGGVLAMRAGMKSAAQSALVGGVILAAIEGLNIAVQRVIMPYMERSQQQSNQVIDMLDPPTDILTAKSIKNKDIWDSVSSMPSSSTTESFSRFEDDASSKSDSLEEPGKPASSWKIW